MSKSHREMMNEMFGEPMTGEWSDGSEAGELEAAGLVPEEVVSPVGTASRRPTCSMCHYPAPLPTLRHFDGLCLGCWEEREHGSQYDYRDECWSCCHKWTGKHGDEPECPKCGALLVG